MDEIIKELMNTSRYLDDDYKNSRYYRDYLDEVNKKLKELTEQNI